MTTTRPVIQPTPGSTMCLCNDPLKPRPGDDIEQLSSEIKFRSYCPRTNGTQLAQPKPLGAEQGRRERINADPVNGCVAGKSKCLNRRLHRREGMVDLLPDSKSSASLHVGVTTVGVSIRLLFCPRFCQLALIFCNYNLPRLVGIILAAAREKKLLSHLDLPDHPMTSRHTSDATYRVRQRSRR